MMKVFAVACSLSYIMAAPAPVEEMDKVTEKDFETATGINATSTRGRELFPLYAIGTKKARMALRNAATARAAGLAAGLALTTVNAPAFAAETKMVKMGP